MKKNYFLALLLLTVTFSFGQSVIPNDSSILPPVEQNNIEGFKLYPNPVMDGTVAITTAKNLIKQVTVFDILGKQLLNRTLTNGILDVSSLNAGVYILKITEDKKTITRKLVVK